MAITQSVGRVGKEYSDNLYAHLVVEDLVGDGVFIGTYDREKYYFQRSSTGKVVSERERNMRDDSDFLAVVLKDDGTFGETLYATTRGWTYANSCVIDASPETLALWKEYQDSLETLRLEREAERRVEEHRLLLLDIVEEAKNPVNGDTVTVVKGRKVPRGTTGVVFWEGTCSYSSKGRIGFKDAEGETYWTASSNCEVSDWKSKIPLEKAEEVLEALSA